MLDVIAIVLLLYILSYLLNYSLILAFLQRSGARTYDAGEPGRQVKDMKYAMLMSLSGFFGTFFIFLHITKSVKRFTGLMLIPGTSNVYWQTMAVEQLGADKLKEEMRNRHHMHDAHFNRRSSPYDRFSSARYATVNQFDSPLNRKCAKADNSGDGRCKSIWD